MGTTHSLRVCVIGAGAAGLEALRVLRAAGHAVDCVERTDRVGGHWHTDYEALHLITPRDSSGFEGRPMPARYPLFPSRAQVVAYLEAFAEDERLRPDIAFATEVTDVAPAADGSGRWVVGTAPTGAGTAREHREYDAVVIANGHHWDPKLPPQAAEFAGTSLHSSQYRSPADLTGRRVLVVGAGNSGCDLAVDAANAGLTTHVSLGHGQVFQPKTFFGRPRAELPVLPHLPDWLAERVARTLVRVSVGTADRYPGLPAPATTNLNRQLPVVNSQLLYQIQHGRVTARPATTRVSGRTVHFADGSADEFDSVLWATGFRVTLPFLDDGLLRWGTGAPLRTAALTTLVGHPGLYCVGLASPRGPQFPVFSAQSRLISRMIALDARLPGPLCRVLESAFGADDRVDILRPVWTRQVRAVERLLDRLEAGPSRPSRPPRPSMAVGRRGGAGPRWRALVAGGRR